MNIKKHLSEMPLLIFIKMLPAALYEYWNFSHNCVRANEHKSSQKILTEILMTSHALEKGLSIHNKNKGFGVAKLSSLLDNIKYYIDSFGYSPQLLIPLSVVNKYIEFQINDGYSDLPFLKNVELFNEILTVIHIERKELIHGGFINLYSKDMISLQHSDFESLCANRYSFRHFSDKRVDDDTIRHALDIAKKAPSACNRQSYRVHVYEGELKNDILYSQGGARGFFKEASNAIIITADMERYYLNEMHLGYVDSSLFAMSLIYAFTYLGIASIPLTICQSVNTLKKFASDYGIPHNEYPVIIIAIGHYPDNAEIAKSERYPVTDFSYFHK